MMPTPNSNNDSITAAWQKATAADRQAQTRQTAEAALRAVEAWKEFNALVRRKELA